MPRKRPERPTVTEPGDILAVHGQRGARYKTIRQAGDEVLVWGGRGRIRNMHTFPMEKIARVVWRAGSASAQGWS